ncbi:Mini-ribonuclease 3 [Phormidesmis priestleyi]
MTSDEQGRSGVLDAGLASPLLETLTSEPIALAQVQRLSPSALAYLGDAVYELQVRRRCLLPPRKLDAYHQQVVAQVRAESQANSLRSLQPHLTDLELDILKRGRNAAYNRPRRVDPEIYQQATSLETLVGYLYLTDPKRLLELFSYLELSPP